MLTVALAAPPLALNTMLAGADENITPPLATTRLAPSGKVRLLPVVQSAAPKALEIRKETSCGIPVVENVAQVVRRAAIADF